MDSCPCSTVPGPPDTGASSSAAPCASASAPSSRVARGLTVLISTHTAPGRSPARIPSWPRPTALRAAVSVTMLNTTSAPSAAARGEPARVMPSATSGSAFSRLRLYPWTAWPAASRRLAMRLPMTPRPTKPRGLMAALRRLDQAHDGAHVDALGGPVPELRDEAADLGLDDDRGLLRLHLEQPAAGCDAVADRDEPALDLAVDGFHPELRDPDLVHGHARTPARQARHASRSRSRAGS